jgi:hypothetical protein
MALCAVASSTKETRAQSLIDPVIAPGEIRLSGGGSMLSWREAFGVAGDRVPLGADLTRDSGADLVPGLDGLTSALTTLVGGGSPLRLGASTALVSHNEVRVPLSVDIGILDRLSIGVTVPLVRTTLEADFRVGTSESADLGANPAFVSGAAVSAFLDLLSTRTGEAQALAAERCGLDPGSAGCAAASGLASALLEGGDALYSAYDASALFPAAGTSTGDALVAWAATLDASLTAEGLSALGSAPPLASTVLDSEGFQGVISDPGGPFAAAPLSSYGGRWALGDVEARVAARVLEGERRDSLGLTTFMWSLTATGAVRLPTGAADSTGIFLDLGRDDGQLDAEVGVFGALVAGRLGLRGRATYTRQQSGQVDRRIVPFGEVLSGKDDVTLVEWDPGDGVTLEVEPAFRLAPAVSLALSYLFVTRGTDRYSSPPGFSRPDGATFPVSRFYEDPSVLDEGTEVRLQEFGGSLTYRSRGLPETGGGGFETFLRVRKAISGSGGRVPAGIRAEFGLRLVRRLWGG